MSPLSILIIILVVALVTFVSFTQARKRPRDPSPPEPNKASDETRDWLIERHAEEAMKLREFQLNSGENDLRSLGFSDGEIQSFEYFFSLSGSKSEILRMSPQRFCGYRAWRVQDENSTMLLSGEREALVQRLKQLSAREQKSFRDSIRLLVT